MGPYRWWWIWAEGGCRFHEHSDQRVFKDLEHLFLSLHATLGEGIIVLSLIEGLFTSSFGLIVDVLRIRWNAPNTASGEPGRSWPCARGIKVGSSNSRKPRLFWPHHLFSVIILTKTQQNLSKLPWKLQPTRSSFALEQLTLFTLRG